MSVHEFTLKVSVVDEEIAGQDPSEWTADELMSNLRAGTASAEVIDYIDADARDAGK